MIETEKVVRRPRKETAYRCPTLTSRVIERTNAITRVGGDVFLFFFVCGAFVSPKKMSFILCVQGPLAVTFIISNAALPGKLALFITLCASSKKAFPPKKYLRWQIRFSSSPLFPHECVCVCLRDDRPKAKQAHSGTLKALLEFHPVAPPLSDGSTRYKCHR